MLNFSKQTRKRADKSEHRRSLGFIISDAPAPASTEQIDKRIMEIEKPFWTSEKVKLFPRAPFVPVSGGA
jgi:hypothetical protein